MRIDRVAERIVEQHLRSKRRRGRTYRPGLLRKLSAPPRKAEGAIDYSISGDLDHQFTAPGAYAGDFGGGGGGTGHATRVKYVAGQTDAMSGEYARVGRDDVGRWRNAQPMALDPKKITRNLRRSAIKAAMNGTTFDASDFARWSRELLGDLSSVACENAYGLLLTPVVRDGSIRIRAVCESCGAVGEAGPGERGRIFHDTFICRFDFCEVCGGRAVERGNVCDHNEGPTRMFQKDADGRWRESRATPEMIEEACR